MRMVPVLLLAACGCFDGPCVGTLADICGDAAQPTQPLVLDGPVDTDADRRCIEITQSRGPALCVLSGTRVDVTGNVRAHGSRALAIVASSEVVVSGTLDVSSRLGDAERGAGADAMGSMPTSVGDGGAFFARNEQPTLTYVHGGAPGGCSPRDPIAHSGGAVYVIAESQIVVDGNIFASAGAPPSNYGNADRGVGCGGASGGLIALEAPHVDIAGIIAANGSGGAVGHLSEGNVSPGPYTPAEDGTTTSFATPARGGTLSKGTGGNGGAVDTLPTSGTHGDGIGTGGDGGGVGVFWVHGELTGSQFSPFPTVP